VTEILYYTPYKNSNEQPVACWIFLQALLVTKDLHKIHLVPALDLEIKASGKSLEVQNPLPSIN
jgi:hypothetical protein